MITENVTIEDCEYEVDFEYYGSLGDKYNKDDYHLLSIRELRGTAELIDSVDEEFKTDVILGLEDIRQSNIAEAEAYARMDQ